MNDLNEMYERMNEMTPNSAMEQELRHRMVADRAKAASSVSADALSSSIPPFKGLN